MARDALHSLADALGIEARWTDAEGRARRVAPEALEALATALGYPAGSAREIAESRARRAAEQNETRLPPLIVATRGRATPLPLKRNARYRIELESGGTREGRIDRASPRLAPVTETGYHRVEIGDVATTLAVAPTRCFSIGDIGDGTPQTRRRWGLAAQIYALRRKHDDGVGDFGALAELAGVTGAARADALAISPVHAMFGAAPERCSPYSPSSRRFLNALLIDPAVRFSRRAIASARSRDTGRDGGESTIDWPRASARKHALLRALYRDHLGGDRKLVADFEAFRARGGDALEEHASFETLHARFVRERGDDWNAALARGVRADDAEEIRYHAFLQWLAAAGLAEAQRRARDAGMAIGLIADLAVGSDPAGSDAWALREEMLGDATIGAPPDFFNANGQGWGLTALSPLAMRARGYRGFIEILRATMRHGGGVRIDHAMNLMRIWIVPRGAAPIDGAYLRYPLDDLLRLLALESWRHRCIVIGEDLGVVPEGFRERMRRARLLGTDVLFFMRRERFLPPRGWRRHAVAMTTTHDLPTLAGWWRGLDIDLRERIGLHSRELAADERERRARDRVLLAEAINAAGTPKRVLAASSADAFVDAAIGFVGATRSELALVPVEDVLALDRQQNVPGTVDEHPNWRQRLAAPAPEALATPDAKRRLHVLAESRSRP